MDNPYNKYRKWHLIGAIALMLVSIPIHNIKYRNMKKADIFYIYSDSKSIANGENPYARTLDGNMKDNDKYSTYFPLFYELGALTIVLGLDSFSSWLSIWQVVFLVFLMGYGLLVFSWVERKMGPIPAYFFLGFLLFHRWIIYLSQIKQIDIMAIFFLVLSLWLLNRNFRWALLCFGLSLALKQVAIFIAPLYLIWAWQQKPSVKYLIQSTLWGAAIPLVVSLPFLIWNFKAFVYSVFFSATRHAASHLGGEPIEHFLGVEGLLAKLPMLLLMILVFLMATKKKIGPNAAVFLVMSVFLGFNSVLFRQYFAWPLLLIPLLFIDLNPLQNFKKLS